MYAFEYHRPQSVADAAKLLAGNGEAKLLAGGHTLIPTMKQRLANPPVLIDLARVSELRGIDRKGSALVIGAMTTHDEVAGSSVVRGAIAGLCEVAGSIGDPHVRNRGTIGGSVANNDPAADYPAAVLALGATIASNKREIAADDFFKGLYQTALNDGEVITAVSFPVPEKAGWQKFRQPASRFALVGVFVAKGKGGVRAAVTGAGASGVFRAKALEDKLAANWSGSACDGVKIDASGLNSDLHGSAEYRAALIPVLAKRAIG